ncbi:UNVERIFIED_CONTAM: hypothetical protein HDU68_004820, partial [Siphonaria sp. JEL0065]
MLDPITLITYAAKGLSWIKSNLITFVLMLTVVLFIWWKNLIQGQADNVVHSKDNTRTPAPQQPVTLSALTRRALLSPSLLLREAVSLGAFHIKWVLAGPLVFVAHPNMASVVLSDKLDVD